MMPCSRAKVGLASWLGSDWVLGMWGYRSGGVGAVVSGIAARKVSGTRGACEVGWCRGLLGP